MQKKIVIANWKLNPATVREAKKIYTGIRAGIAKTRGVQVVVCPPYVFLPELAANTTGTKVLLGVQDLFYEETGAHTGQVSASMVRSFKAKVAIVGHSEQRALGESNERVGNKVRHVIRQNLTAVLCVGERERNDEGTHYTFVRDQLDAVFTGLKRAELERLIIAYEPVWAIGKSANEAMQTSELYETSLFIKKLLIERFGRNSAECVRVLYGGSVKADNAQAFIREGGVDGLLVGSASLKPEQFSDIVAAVADAARM